MAEVYKVHYDAQKLFPQTEPEPAVLYSTASGIARITLNRPRRSNAIDVHLPQLLEKYVNQANTDPDVRVIVVSGNGRGFCSGYDLELFAQYSGPVPGSQKMPWDPLIDYQFMWANTNAFMSLWRSLKPTICKLHGFAVAGGSDIALCCDLILMADDAKIGYPPARIWGCPTTAMWVYRVGAEKAKRMLLTGDVISGKEAERIGLVTASYPVNELDSEVEKLARRIASVPSNQLMMQKMVINQAFENMGMSSTQRLATFFDGVARHSPEGIEWKRKAEEIGWKAAVQQRDQGKMLESDVKLAPQSRL